jgi:hypothetical protein
MTRLLTLALLLIFTNAFGQTENVQTNKIEIYLLKSIKPNLDTVLKLRGPFLANVTDLADTAFIKNHEILGYTFKRDSAKFKDSIYIDNRHKIEVTSAVTERINNLKIPLCCGRQFALTVNGDIVYTGYFWNLVSSWGCDGITAFAYDTKIDILRKLPDYETAIDSEDPRRNSILFECLKKTNRLHK